MALGSATNGSSKGGGRVMKSVGQWIGLLLLVGIMLVVVAMENHLLAAPPHVWGRRTLDLSVGKLDTGVKVVWDLDKFPAWPSNYSASKVVEPHEVKLPEVPAKYQHVLDEWRSRMGPESLHTLATMLATRDDKLRKYDGVPKVAHACMPQPDARLGPILLNIKSNIEPDWTFHIFTSPETEEWIKTVPEVAQVGAKVTRYVPANLTYEGYGYMLREPEYWNLLEADYILTFQVDSVFCSKSPFKLIDFIEYPWIGAPWGWNLHNKCGNGGLSLRHKDNLLLAANEPNCRPIYYHAEDFFYCECFEKHVFADQSHNLFRAPYKISRHFSVEMVEGWEAPLGVHAAGKYAATQMKEFWDYCPEALLTKKHYN